VVKTCSFCGKEIKGIHFFKCSYCGQVFCPEHRLPEEHNCDGLQERSLDTYKERKTVISVEPVEFREEFREETTNIIGTDTWFKRIEPERTEPESVVQEKEEPERRAKKSTGKYVLIGMVVAVILLVWAYFYVPEFRLYVESLKNEFQSGLWSGVGGALRHLTGGKGWRLIQKDCLVDKTTFATVHGMKKRCDIWGL